ncbi:MAG: indolepyruvate ferredoxin oxidoreductase subunit alpha [Woeseia sp.]
MAERSFEKEIRKLRLGAGEEFSGEGILAVTKALLQSGVSYVGGYQGAPISHLMDVLADAEPLLKELGVHFETSASEASAAAMLAASVNYPLRGAVTWKSIVGTNVASDALSNVSSGGVKGGALIIIGEDYGEGSSIMQERTHAFAMKSQIWLLDPRPNLNSIVGAVETGFKLSEASNTPVMLELRMRACHVYGRFISKDNKRPDFGPGDAMENPVRDLSRIVLPPASFVHEKEKISERLPAAIDFIKSRRLNEFFGPENTELGIAVQGGLYNNLIRALEMEGLSDCFGATSLPLYVLNVAYPLIDEEVASFCAGKKAVLVIEEGQPDYIEQAMHAILRKRDIQTRLLGKDLLPMAGEYTSEEIRKGVTAFIREWGNDLSRLGPRRPGKRTGESSAPAELADVVPPRPPGFCTGCPERPVFSAMKMLDKEMAPSHVSCDVGCHLFSILPPFNIGNTTMGYGLGWAGASAFNTESRKRTVSFMGDGGFWHNGLSSGVGNAVFNKNDNVLVIIDNNYAAATGGQEVPSSQPRRPTRSTGHSIQNAVKGVGVKWLKTVHTYDVEDMRATLREALATKEKGPKVIVAEGECMLNRQRREQPIRNRMAADGKRVMRTRFGVDADTCTGDHSCIRLSGCPSLTIRDNPDPLREDPVAYVDNTCVGCGNCGEVAHAAVLCPSFYSADIVRNPNRGERIVARVRGAVIEYLQRREQKRREYYAF